MAPAPRTPSTGGFWCGGLGKESGKLDVVILRPQGQAKDLPGKTTFRSGNPAPGWSCFPQGLQRREGREKAKEKEREDSGR